MATNLSHPTQLGLNCGIMDAETYKTTAETLGTLLTIAWLLPLAGFAIEIFGGYWGTRVSKTAAYIAVFCIGTAFVCSLSALIYWGEQTHWAAFQPHGASHGGASHGGAAHGAAAHDAAHPPQAAHAEHAGRDAHHKAHDAHPKAGDAHKREPHKHADGAADKGPAGHAHPPAHQAQAVHRAEALQEAAEAQALAAHRAKPDARNYFTGTHYVLAHFGSLKLSIDYYIDSLTLLMFTMVTFIASLIHIFAIGYMSDELTEDHEDHQVHTHHGHLHRPGRFYRFFAFLSLFSFSMLGLVLAGNIFLVFVFWELVGVCSYFLIGFYTERKSASTAANKAFIMNRVGDFGFLIGLMIVWTWFGTFQFAGDRTASGPEKPGLFDMVRGADGAMMLLPTSSGQTVVVMTDRNDDPLVDPQTRQPRTIPYFLLVAAGIGIFGGCVGKSAQFPLQTWLPDAMEGPTPVSALVHSATMVAAGVYLAGRFYPMFTPEVLLTIAYVGCITLFLGATIAIVGTDIKRVLAYSTISQLGYMMLGLGLGGWAAGLFHLITHAFFKSLMFLCSGSVIYGCHHVQEMPQMGGLRRKMPITAYTMLVGVIAISGLAIPVLGTSYTFAFSGYHSKDAIVATALTHTRLNPTHLLLFVFPLVTAGMTAFYMFRLWFYTFAGTPRDHHVYDHAHESPQVMYVPLVILAFFAAFCAIGGEQGPLFLMLLGSEPAGVAAGADAAELSGIALPGHAAVAANHAAAGLYALVAAVLGAVTAYFFYAAPAGQRLSPAEVRRHFAALHTFLVEKWRFDELYDVMFVRPAHVVARWCAGFDRVVLDGFLHATSKLTIDVSRWDRRFDESIIDGFVNMLADVTFGVGRSFRVVQTGRLRQYVMFIVVGVVGIGVFVWLLAA